MKLPQIRNQNIVIQEIGGEIMIYDLEINKAYCLNETSAIVYQNCDGKTDFADLNGKYNFPNEIIYLALDQLQKENLLEKNAEFLSPFNGLSRREVVKKVGLGSMIALPVIASVVAPSAINAASGCDPGLLAPGQMATWVCVAAVGDCAANNGCSLVFPALMVGAPLECCSGAANLGMCVAAFGGEICACICA